MVSENISDLNKLSLHAFKFFNKDLFFFIIPIAYTNENAIPSIVARKNHILGIEGIEGTNELIKRCGKYYNEQLNDNNLFGPVLIKLPKLNQTLDLDIPVIGIDTIKLAHKHNFFGIGFSEKGVLIVNEPEIRSFCESKNFYLQCIGD